jgi:site-specific recombinase XerD
VVLPDSTVQFVVLGVDGLPISEVDEFLNVYLAGIGRSPNTVSSYASHLSLFFRWVAENGADWRSLGKAQWFTFLLDLQSGSLRSLTNRGTERPVKKRGRSTAKAIRAAVITFLGYHADRLHSPGEARAAARFHVDSRKQIGSAAARSIEVGFRGEGPKTPAIVNFEVDLERLLAASNRHRDALLLLAMYDGGLRISQALGLKHEDVDFARKSIRIVRRLENENGALSKQRQTFNLDMPERFFDEYARVLVDEQLLLGIDSSFVFVNLSSTRLGLPMQYRNAFDIVKSIGSRSGITLTPHVLRHTHGTALARAGWSAPQIAKRLGQSSPSSADVYIHLAEEDISSRYAATSFAQKERR